VLSTIYNYLVGTGFADDVNRGMQLVLVAGNETEVLDKVPRPEVEGYLTFGGNVYGNHSHHPTMVHYKDRWANDQ
jgi:hypothetical protein